VGSHRSLIPTFTLQSKGSSGFTCSNILLFILLKNECLKNV
jgi:hypothetical protein